MLSKLRAGKTAAEREVVARCSVAVACRGTGEGLLITPCAGRIGGQWTGAAVAVCVACAEVIRKREGSSR